MPSAQHNIIRCQSVTVSFGRVVALRDVSLAIPCGSLTAIVGPNGAGKSSLLKAILGWLPLDQGEIRIGDAHPQHALPRLAYLPQRQVIDWDFPITVREVVRQGRYPARRFWQRLRATDHASVERALGELGLLALADRPIRALSGGQQQRVFLARALAQGADVFLLDEPFAGLDLFATEELLHVLQAWRAQGRTVLAVVHDVELARRQFEWGVLLATQLVAAGPVQEALAEPLLRSAYSGSRCLHADPLRLSRTTQFPA